MIRRPPRSTRKESSAASDVYKRQEYMGVQLIIRVEVRISIDYLLLPSFPRLLCWRLFPVTYQNTFIALILLLLFIVNINFLLIIIFVLIFCCLLVLSMLFLWRFLIAFITFLRTFFFIKFLFVALLFVFGDFFAVFIEPID
eukprot:TRINITY_DN1411_c0_g1_i7.p1 TRINITY_DN1411_c0_g1~~TRINITY_DN1411_c0_g1_i7.p1  ORF type:complete len:149 (-),score=37.49 TRINITY_DN1411_c0_g1_i7:715-1140(-)